MYITISQIIKELAKTLKDDLRDYDINIISSDTASPEMQKDYIFISCQGIDNIRFGMNEVEEEIRINVACYLYALSLGTTMRPEFLAIEILEAIKLALCDMNHPFRQWMTQNGMGWLLVENIDLVPSQGDERIAVMPMMITRRLANVYDVPIGEIVKTLLSADNEIADEATIT